MRRLLIGLVVLLTAACVFGAVLVVQEHRDRGRSETEQARYAAVLDAATTEVEALINIDYRDAQSSVDAVAAGATGDFAEDYDSSAPGVLAKLAKHRSVMEGTVVWAGVSRIGADEATVLAATTGTVANKASGDQPVARNYRIKVGLVLEDGAWKTSTLEFVG